MKNQRQSGILLHVTCLPSPFGIGDMGPGAYRFVEFLNSPTSLAALPVESASGADAVTNIDAPAPERSELSLQLEQ